MKNYFPHDHHARSDKKIINLMRVFGLAGVGLYWCIIEMLYEENGWLKISDLESIAYDLRADTNTLNSLVSNFDLFFIEGEMFSSKAVLSRLKLIEAKSSAASKAARQRWQKCKEDANAMQTHSERNALNKIKTNEIKLNESKTDNNATLSHSQKEGSEMGLGSMQSGNDPNGTPLLERTNLKAEPEKPKEKSSAKKEKVSRPWASEIQMPYPSKAFAEKWKEYCHYRETKKPKAIPFNSQSTEQRLLTKLSAYNEAFAIYQIDRAMESNWQGLVFLETPKDFKKFLENRDQRASTSKIQERVGVMQEVQQNRKYDKDGNRIAA